MILKNAKTSLRKFISENKEQVAKDLEEMKEKSSGGDIFEYIENAFGRNSVSEVVDMTYDERIKLWCESHGKSEHWVKI